MQQGTTQFNNARLNAIGSLTPTAKLPVVGDGSSYVMGTSGMVGTYRLNPVSHTGTTNPTEVGRMTFPANTFQEGDWLVAWLNQGPRAAVAGNLTPTLQFYSDTTNRAIWAPVAANTTRNILRSIYFENGLWSVHADDVNTTNFSNYGTAVFRQAISFNQPSSLRVNFTLANAADTYWLNYLVVNHFRSAVL